MTRPRIKYRWFRAVIASASLALISSPSFAVQGNFAYQRSTLRIEHQAPIATDPSSLPWQSDASGVSLQVELRSADSTRAPGWFNLSSYSDNRGLLLALDTPGPISIAPVNQFAPVDIFLINEYGEITQIMPGIVLADLQEPLTSDGAVLAALYLKGGAAQNLAIQPGDKVAHAMFKKRTLILRAPGKAETPPAPTNPVTVKTTQPAQKTAKPAAKSAKSASTTNTNAQSKAYPLPQVPSTPDDAQKKHDELIDKILRQNGEGAP